MKEEKEKNGTSVSGMHDPINGLDSNLLKVAVGLSALVFIIMLQAHHNHDPGDPKAKAMVSSLTQEVALVKSKLDVAKSSGTGHRAPSIEHPAPRPQHAANTGRAQGVGCTRSPDTYQF